MASEYKGPGLPTQEQRDAAKGIYSTARKCPRCKSQLKNFEGGDQGDLSFDYCESCDYQKY